MKEILDFYIFSEVYQLSIGLEIVTNTIACICDFKCSATKSFSLQSQIYDHFFTKPVKE